MWEVVVPRPYPALLALALLVPQVVVSGSAAAPALSRPRTRVTALDTQRRIDAGAINMWVTNVGSFAWDIGTGLPGLIYPKGSDQRAVFAAGLWIGAKVGGQTRVTVGEYSQEYGPGRIVGGFPDDPSRPEYVVYKVAAYAGDPQDTAHVERSAGELAADPNLDPLLHHSWSEYLTGAAPHGAPVRVHRLPDTSTPDPSDLVDVPGPDVRGDQMLWAVFNDADPSLHGNDAGGTSPLGVEVQQSFHTFAATGVLGSTVFLEFKIIHKGSSVLDSAFVALWVDPDVGGFTDDLAACDTLAGRGYAYNATNTDATYGASPPAVGVDLLRGAIVAGDTLGLYAFNSFVNGTDPTTPEQSYNYMQGLEAGGTTRINPTTGGPTRYMFSGDPVAGSGWLDTSPGDKRILLSTGPFTMVPGDTQAVLLALVIGQTCDRLASVTKLRLFDDFVQRTLDAGFGGLGLPDLVVTDLCAPAIVQGCRDLEAAYSIVNLGGDAGGFTGRLDLVPSSGGVLQRREMVVPGLPAGASASDTLRRFLADADPRVDYTLRARADWFAQVYESNETNNLLERQTTHAVPRIVSMIQVSVHPDAQARITFQRSERDAEVTATPVQDYEIYRKIDPSTAASERSGIPAGAAPASPEGPSGATLETGPAQAIAVDPTRSGPDPRLLLAGWEYVGSVPAHAETEYNAIVPLLSDTPSASGYELFFVRAATAAPTVYFDSCVDSMPEVDSLPPPVPENFRVTGTTANGGFTLGWDPSGSADLRFFELYRGTDVGFTPTELNRIARTTATTFADSGTGGIDPAYYKLSATDYVGNTSEFATASSQVVDVSPDTPVPRDFALYPGRPNPTRRGQLVRFDLPQAARVRLHVFDIHGRIVRTALEGAWLPAGRHDWYWDGRADDGSRLRAGIYVLRLESGLFRGAVRAALIP